MRLNVSTNSSSTATPLASTRASNVGHVSFINPHLSKFNVETSTTDHDDRLPTTINSILYNISVNEDYDDSSEYSNVAVNELINNHIKLSHVPRVSPIVPNVTESDIYLAVRNVSSLPCLNHIPSVHEYLAGKFHAQYLLNVRVVGGVIK